MSNEPVTDPSGGLSPAREAEIRQRLEAFIRHYAPGSCKIFSRGSGCECPLCDVDELRAALATVRQERDALQVKLQEIRTQQKEDFDRAEAAEAARARLVAALHALPREKMEGVFNGQPFYEESIKWSAVAAILDQEKKP